MKGLAFVKDPDGYWVELVARGTPGKILNKCNFSQTMLRVKDPRKSLEFYKKMGMKLLVEKHFDDFSLYFLGSSVVSDDSNPKEMFQPCLELTHNHGTESNEDFKHFSGNEDERKGFGHIGFLVDDVYKACDEIGKMGYGFKKVRHEWQKAPRPSMRREEGIGDCRLMNSVCVGTGRWNDERSCFRL
jgi:lactoylglutathione lyase